MFEAREILDLAIHLEENGCRTYRRAAAGMQNSQLATLLEWMAKEETAHADRFRGWKERFTEKPQHAFTDEMTIEMIRGAVGDRLFSLEEVDFSACRSVGELIRIFITFEEDTIAFYEILSALARNREARDMLSALVAEERKHVDLLKAFSRDEEPLSLILRDPVT